MCESWIGFNVAEIHQWTAAPNNSSKPTVAVTIREAEKKKFEEGTGDAEKDLKDKCEQSQNEQETESKKKKCNGWLYERLIDAGGWESKKWM